MATKKELKAEAVAAAKREAWLKKARILLGHVWFNLPKSVALEAYDKGQEPEAFAADYARREPVGAAVHPLKAVAVAYARQQAQKTIDRVAKELEAAGWDREAYAPYPSYSKPSYETKMRHYRLVHGITASKNVSRRPGDADPCTMSAKLCGMFIDNAASMAAAQYDAFIVKLVHKIGPGAVSATLTGNHVWGHSIMTVHMVSTEVQRWKTQQIVNYSKLGNDFYQWPTRKMK